MDSEYIIKQNGYVLGKWILSNEVNCFKDVLKWLTIETIDFNIHCWNRRFREIEGNGGL